MGLDVLHEAWGMSEAAFLVSGAWVLIHATISPLDFGSTAGTTILGLIDIAWGLESRCVLPMLNVPIGLGCWVADPWARGNRDGLSFGGAH